MLPSFMFRKNLVFEMWGKRGSNAKFFAIISKTICTMWLIFTEKVDIIALHRLGKFQVQNDVCSRDMGEIAIRNESFRDFPKKFGNNLVRSLTDSRYYSITYASKVSSPYLFSFSRYGAKSGQKVSIMMFFEIFSITL